MKFIKSKLAINDMSIIAIFMFIFFGTAIIINFVADATDQTISTFNTAGLESAVLQDAENTNRLSAFNVLITVLKLALFDWGGTLSLPFWLQGIYTVLAILFVLVIARNLWIGGGG